MNQYLFSIAASCCFTAVAQDNDSLAARRWSWHAQTTIVNQTKPAFDVPYSGVNSLSAEKENKTSITTTFYAGMKLWKNAAVFVNPEIAGGSGLSQALGIAAATNGETFRIGDPAPHLYLARLYYRQLVALTKTTQYQANDLNQVAGDVPTKYVSLTVGKVSIADYFDRNQYSHDPRTQFLSWGLMSNGAWDYPANTRGYTPSVILEWVTPKNEWRIASSMVATTANGNTMNTHITKANSTTLEYTRHYTCSTKKGAIRLLAFYTTANMGSYRQSMLAPIGAPSIETSRQYGHSKYGFAINFEQQLFKQGGLFFRGGWNDGHNETWAFTEIDRSASAGVFLNGEKWRRKQDGIGIAYAFSALSSLHRDYLTMGGKGFMLGDGQLNYGGEQLAEFYYCADLYQHQLFLTGTYQMIINPGYNKDRKGPVHVFSVRLHLVI
jgi:high affinity Mn2+ porin